MWKDNSRIPYYERTLKEKIPYDPEKQYAVLRVSICTGEKVAGFKNYDDGHFTEVMLIRDMEDEKRFKAIYGLDEIKKEY
ncbi:MAG: aspartate dehydrogenase [Lachnospiraceae bacterium]|nr:aspartate dehydrogenase [Lachnospiraceae bacterium]